MPGRTKAGSFPARSTIPRDEAPAPIAAVSAVLGAAGWWLGLEVGPGPTALNAGWTYLLILAIAGFVLGLLERDLSWTALAGLLAGQLAGLLVQAAAGTKFGLPLAVASPVRRLGHALRGRRAAPSAPWSAAG